MGSIQVGARGQFGPLATLKQHLGWCTRSVWPLSYPKTASRLVHKVSFAPYLPYNSIQVIARGQFGLLATLKQHLGWCTRSVWPLSYPITASRLVHEVSLAPLLPYNSIQVGAPGQFGPLATL